MRYGERTARRGGRRSRSSSGRCACSCRTSGPAPPRPRHRRRWTWRAAAAAASRRRAPGTRPRGRGRRRRRGRMPSIIGGGGDAAREVRAGRRAQIREERATLLGVDLEGVWVWGLAAEVVALVGEALRGHGRGKVHEIVRPRQLHDEGLEVVDRVRGAHLVLDGRQVGLAHVGAIAEDGGACTPDWCGSCWDSRGCASGRRSRGSSPARHRACSCRRPPRSEGTRTGTPDSRIPSCSTQRAPS